MSVVRSRSAAMGSCRAVELLSRTSSPLAPVWTTSIFHPQIATRSTIALRANPQRALFSLQTRKLSTNPRRRQQAVARKSEEEDDDDHNSSQNTRPTDASTTNPPSPKNTRKWPNTITGGNSGDATSQGASREDNEARLSRLRQARGGFDGTQASSASSTYGLFNLGSSGRERKGGPIQSRDGSFNIGRMLLNNLPSEGATNERPRSPFGLFNPGQGFPGFERRDAPEVDLTPPPFHCSPRLGRTIAVDRYTDVARAFRQLEIRCNANKVKQDFYKQRFHERPGIKRKRLKSERWRRRFKEDFQAVVRRVQVLRRQGW